MTEARPNPGSDAMAEALTVAQALQRSGLPFREARRLLATLLQVPDTWLLTHDDHLLAPDQAGQFALWSQRRRLDEPLAYVLGWREFFGHAFRVSPAVLIPRPETELLVEAALAALPAPVATGVAPRVLDLGTGSGAIAVSVALERPDADVWATDLSPEALELARENADSLGARVGFAQGHWWGALKSIQPDAMWDVVVSNPPYVAAGDPHLEQGDLRFEPASALTDHADGLSHLRQIIEGAPQWLRPGGWLWLEHGYDQAPALRQLLSQAEGWCKIESRRDLAGIERITGGCRELRSSVAGH